MAVVNFLLLALASLPVPALAAGLESLPGLSGANLPLLWGLPFAGLLLSIAIVPLVNARFWHAHFGKVAAAWSVALILPFALMFGAEVTIQHVVHAIVAEYLPFVVILFALYMALGLLGLGAAATKEGWKEIQKGLR